MPLPDHVRFRWWDRSLAGKNWRPTSVRRENVQSVLQNVRRVQSRVTIRKRAIGRYIAVAPTCKFKPSFILNDWNSLWEGNGTCASLKRQLKYTIAASFPNERRSSHIEQIGRIKSVCVSFVPRRNEYCQNRPISPKYLVALKDTAP